MQTIERSLGPGKINHKGMEGRLHAPGIFERWSKIHGYQLNFDPGMTGGLVRKDDLVAGYVRPPPYRASRGRELTLQDVRPVTLKNKPSKELSFDRTDSGLEIEFFGFDPEGEVIPMMNNGDAFLRILTSYNNRAKSKGRKNVGVTREMSSNCVEATFDHDTDINNRIDNYLTTIQTVVAIAECLDIGIAPIAIIPHRRLSPEDVTQDEYHRRLTFDIQTWDAAQHFDIASIQPHAEILDHVAARKAINYLQFANPILFAPTVSGPFMDGKINPNPFDRYSSAPHIDEDPLKKETLERVSPGQYHSLRPFGRFFGSPSGGILREPFPVSEKEFLDSVEIKLNKGEIPSAGREGGHHTDRYRCDILPYGTIESCVMDPSGGRLQRNVAMREIFNGLLWKMQIHFIDGTFDEKAKEFTALFGQEPTVDSFRTTHWNLLEVARDGTNANIQGMDNQKYTIKDMWHLLKRYIQEPLVDEKNNINYQGLPSGIIEEVDKSFADPSGLYEFFRDENGFTSTRGYYETGIGTMSQWMIQGAKDRIAGGVTEKQAIMAVTVDVANSFRVHTKQMTLDKLKALFLN